MAQQELDQLKPFLRDYVEGVTRKSKGGLYVCPICGSGKGAHHTGAFSVTKDGQRWSCFKCDKGGDIFDLYAAVNACTLSEATKAIIEQYGRSSAARDFAPANGRKTGDQAEQHANPPEPQRHDYSEYLTRCAAALEGSEGETYLKGRGFTSETVKRFKLGYDPACYNKQLQKKTPSIIIPYSGSMTYYASRAIDEKAYDKPTTGEAGHEPIFNGAALYSSDVVFIVESQLCAISIAQEGGAAVAIGGMGKGRLLDQLKKKPTKAALVLCLDNDNAGRKATQEIGDALKEAGVFFLEANIAGEYKDPNEALQHDAEALRRAISETFAEVIKARQIEAQAEIEAYQQESAAGYVDAFFGGVTDSVNTPAIPTGFVGLDKMLEGGLYEGLYIIGAISSLGKTTFVLQAADQIAAAGQDVIIFSLEMARNELIAKSISRLTYKQAQGKTLAKTTRGITTGKRYARYTDAEIQLIEDAKEAYRQQISGHVWITEGIGNIGAEQIRADVKRHIAIMGRKPVIVIDYLQILAPFEMRATDKQNTDKAVLELKRISRDYKIPIIGISSFNRDNYTAPVNMAAFKESGAIEYSSDVLIGLQYVGMDYQEGEADKAREKRIRELIKGNEAAAREGGGVEIELKVLKNRNGGRGTSDPLTFYPMFNTFIEHPAGFTVTDEETPFTGKGKRF